MASLLFKTRSAEKEILDDFDLQGHDLARNLKELQRVNTRLGGYTPILEGLRKITGSHRVTKPLQIVDMGCGGGDVLRKLYHWCEANLIPVQLSGLDANPAVIDLARNFSEGYPIQWEVADVFSESFGKRKTDVLLFNLFFHHFSEDEIIHILRKCRLSSRHVLISDLQRSRLAYQLFRLVSRAFNFSYISRNDGKLSIKKSFTKKDWQRMLSAAGITHYTIRWQWAFRYSVHITNCRD